jgi:hypothetical protein
VGKPCSEQIGALSNRRIGIRRTAVDVYYGYCFDSGIDEYCYWYPASDVVVADTWVPY